MLGPVFVAFVLIVGLAAVATAFSFALRPEERKLAVLRPLSASVAFSAPGASLLGLINGFVATARRLGEAPVPDETFSVLFAGLAEALIPTVLGFTLLGVAWLLAAIGFRRQP